MWIFFYDPDQEERLPRHPSERDQLATGSKRGVVGGIEGSCHPALADLHPVTREHQHISEEVEIWGKRPKDLREDDLRSW